MANTTYIDSFIPEGKTDTACVTCGLCLRKCPAMKMDKEESKAEFKRLLNGEEPLRVLKECNFCFSCNRFCPQGLRPYNLIMERITENNKKNGKTLPPSVAYMFTGKNPSGFFCDQYNAAPDEDKAILDRWSQKPQPSKDTLFIGCYGRTVPQGIEHAGSLKSLVKFGPRDACCGEIPHRFGEYPTFTETVDRTYEQLAALDTERLVCYCGSCANYLGNVWPNYHGVRLPFEVISLYEWLWDKYQAGELTIKNRQSKEIVLSDSCYGSELGDRFFDALRGLHQAAGMTVVELENSRYDALCCGFSSGIRNGNDPKEIAAVADKKVNQILDSRVTEVSCNCPGCWAGISRAGAEKGLKVRFAINEILKAFGDNPYLGRQ